MNIGRLILNTRAYKVLEKDIVSNNFSHAYMFVSNDMLYLQKLEQYILSRIFCQSNRMPCLECVECRRVLNNSQPDVMIYPKSDKFNVNEVSNLIGEIYLKPVEKDFKIFVLNNCDEMNTQAQNKLLKILEEPPANTHLLLFCKNKSAMLNTVLSRVKLLETPPISPEEIFDVIKDEEDVNFAKVAAFNSFGSLQRAEEILHKENFLKILDFCYLVCLKLNTEKDLPQVLSKFNSFKDNLEDILNLLQLLLRDCIMERNGLSKLTVYDSEKISKINEGFLEKSLAKLILAINNCRMKLKFNCNSQAVFDILCLDIINYKKKNL